MRNVGTNHEIAIIADPRDGFPNIRTRMDVHHLPERASITNFDGNFGYAFVFEILWGVAHRDLRVEQAILAHFRVSGQGHMANQLGPVTQYNVFADRAERADFDVRAELSPVFNDRRGMDRNVSHAHS